MKVLLLLVLVALSGCHANIRRQPRPRPQPQVDMVKDVFWEYVAKATTTAEESVKQIRDSQLGKDLNSLISESSDTVSRLSEMLQTQVAPLTQDLVARVSQEAELLTKRLEKDLSAAGARLQPYAHEILSDLQKQVEELRRDTSLYPVDPEALTSTLLQRSQELRKQLESRVEQLQVQMVPYAEEIQEKVEQSLEEFQRSLVPMAQSFEQQLNQKTQQIQQSLSPFREELKAKLDASAQDLQQQLLQLWSSFTKNIQ